MSIDNETPEEQAAREIKLLGIDRWFFEIPLSDVRTFEPSGRESGDECFLCGKRGLVAPRYWVHFSTGGDLVSTAEPFAQSQGFFPIESECRKRLPNNFVFENI